MCIGGHCLESDSTRIISKWGHGSKFPYIRVGYPDSQPRATEEVVTLPIEDHLSDLEGLKTITSRSRADNASINVEFSSFYSYECGI